MVTSQAHLKVAKLKRGSTKFSCPFQGWYCWIWPKYILYLLIPAETPAISTTVTILMHVFLLSCIASIDFFKWKILSMCQIIKKIFQVFRVLLSDFSLFSHLSYNMFNISVKFWLISMNKSWETTPQSKFLYKIAQNDRKKP